MDNEKEDMRYLYYGMSSSEVPRLKNKGRKFRAPLRGFLPLRQDFFDALTGGPRGGILKWNPLFRNRN